MILKTVLLFLIYTFAYVLKAFLIILKITNFFFLLSFTRYVKLMYVSVFEKRYQKLSFASILNINKIHVQNKQSRDIELFQICQIYSWLHAWSVSSNGKLFFLKFIILIYKRMLHLKENYLNIQYERGRGLKLNWNFKDILGREKFFRHLIIIADNQKEFVCSFVENFYKKMKYGDILSCIYFTPDKQVRLCDWVQKTHINRFKVESYLKYTSYAILDESSKIELLKMAALQTVQNHDFTVVNILMGQKDSSSFYKQFIENRRLNGDEFNYIVNIFGKTCQNKVSIHKGINYFKSSLENVKEYVKFYHNFINSAVMPYASIKIECLNGQIGLFNQQKWRSEDFNIIQAKFYGPSSQFSYDQLLFYIQDLARQMNITLQITLSFKLFTLKKYETVKKMHLTYDYEKDGSLTMYEVRYARYKIYKDIYLEEDPYESITVVKIFQNLDNNSSNFQLL